jgi:hypothetical protein
MTSIGLAVLYRVESLPSLAFSDAERGSTPAM